MARSPKVRRRSEVIAHSEAILANRRPGPFGQEACNDDDPGAGRDEWKQVGRIPVRVYLKSPMHTT